MPKLVTAEDQDKFIRETLDKQLDWHDAKAGENQNRYKFLRTVVLIVATTIPFLSGLIGKDGWDFLPLVIGVAGIVVAICEGLIALNKYQENWIAYRDTAEALRREKSLYETGSGVYAADDEPFQELVVNVHRILGNEVQRWTTVNKPSKEKTSGAKG